MLNPLIAMHIKDDQKWFLVARERHNWGGWSEEEKSWIDKLIKINDDSLIIGNTMFEYVYENK
jgi:hypothetical protein